MDYEKTIQELVRKTWEKSPNQITIKLINEANELLIFEAFLAEMQISVGALCYRVAMVMEVLNPELEYDKELLTELEASLSELNESLNERSKEKCLNNNKL